MQGILGALIIWGYYAFTILKGRNKKNFNTFFIDTNIYCRHVLLIPTTNNTRAVSKKNYEFTRFEYWL